MSQSGSTPGAGARIVEPSVTLALTLLLVAFLSLAIAWLIATPRAAAFMAFAVVVAAAAAVVLEVRARSRRASVTTGTGAALLGVWALLDSWSFEFALTYAAHLRVELVLAILPGIAVLLMLRGLERAREDLAGSAHVLRLPMSWTGPALLLIGGIARWGEVWMLAGQPGTVETLAHVLRYDAAHAIWAVATFLIAGSLAYAAWASTDRARRRSPRRVVVAAALALLLFSFVGYDIAISAAALASPPSALKLGMHTSNVAGLDPALVDYAHVEVPWSRVESEQGVLNWTVYDAEVRAAEEKGLGVYLLAGTYAPDWVVRLYPDAMMVDQNGKPFTWIDEAPTASRTRVWDLSFAHHTVVAMKSAFLAKVVERYADSPAVFTIAVQNEPAWPVDWNLFRYASYDPFTVSAFRDALTLKYASVSVMNENLSTSYAGFAHVEAPRNAFDPLWPEWMVFREDLLIRFVNDQIDAVKERTDKPVTVKIMAHFATRFAQPQAGLSDRVMRAFVSASDVVSVDIYPVSIGDLRRELEYFSHIADGKPLILGEFNLLLGSNLPAGGAQLLSALDVISRYATHVTLFTDDSHFLYGVHALARAPSLVALELWRMDALDPNAPSLVGALIIEDLLAVQNIYPMYVLGTQAIGLPAIPGPLLLLVILPVPSTTGRLKRFVNVGRVGAISVAAAFVLLAMV